MAAFLSNPDPHGPAGEAAGLPLPRLVEQLQALSRVAETLTVRLLELEERFEDQEARLLPRIEAAQAQESAALQEADLRLGETEERLARLEELLQGVDRSLRTVPRASLRAIRDADAFSGEGDPGDEDPFPEEGEQPFMDERIA
jgi:hypothetical protein